MLYHERLGRQAGGVENMGEYGMDRDLIWKGSCGTRISYPDRNESQE